ncbi:cobalt ECF transporter T component CbiQ [Clostridia bacterium]|nr:cobalt ECF transporter T component CbiQ [Clostridia bacterium]
MLSNRVHDLYVLESLSDGDTVVHRLHPQVKLIATLAFIITIVSFNRYDVLGAVPYFIYPILILSLAELPAGMLHRRFLIALPFCSFAAVTNLILLRETAFVFGGIAFSWGFLSMLAILLRTYLCVMAVFILIATTPFPALTRELRRLHAPKILITLIEMIYRYIGVLIDEAGSMAIAYKLRSVKSKGIAMKDMGSFVGQLAIRSFDRGERIYAAMACRGYGRDIPDTGRTRMAAADIVCMILFCTAFVLLRFFPVLHML